MPVFRFDANSKEAYGPWWAMGDVVGRWMRIVGLGGCKMEDDDGGRTGHPADFSISRLNKIDIFLIVSRN